MLDVVVADGGGKLGLEGDDPPIAPLNDQVDLMVAPVGAEMAGGRLGGLGVDPNTEGHERLEEGPEERAVARNGDGALVAIEEGPGPEAEQGDRESWVNEMVLGGGCELVKVTGCWEPGGKRVEDVEPFECVPVRDGGGLGRLLPPAGGRGIAERLERRSGSRRRGVGGQPPPQPGWVTHWTAELREVPI